MNLMCKLKTKEKSAALTRIRDPKYALIAFRGTKKPDWIVKHHKEIKIKGTVTKSVSILMQSGFIVKDKTGEIFVVVSGKMPPKINDVVTLKGKIVVVGSINDKNFIYFKESKNDNN